MLVSAFGYAITVMVVRTGAVEIGQGISGTGAMEMEDVQAGLSGFLMMFVVYAAIRFVVLKVYGWITGGDESDRRAKHCPLIPEKRTAPRPATTSGTARCVCFVKTAFWGFPIHCEAKAFHV